MSDLERGFEAWYKSEHEPHGETVDLTKSGHMRVAYYVGRAHGESELTAARDEAERLRGRVAQLESAVPWTIYGDNLTATVLRKQAEAVEACETKLNKLPGAALWDLDQVQLWLDQEAGCLRQQADEAEQ